MQIFLVSLMLLTSLSASASESSCEVARTRISSKDSQSLAATAAIAAYRDGRYEERQLGGTIAQLESGLAQKRREAFLDLYNSMKSEAILFSPIASDMSPVAYKHEGSVYCVLITSEFSSSVIAECFNDESGACIGKIQSDIPSYVRSGQIQDPRCCGPIPPRRLK